MGGGVAVHPASLWLLSLCPRAGADCAGESHAPPPPPTRDLTVVGVFFVAASYLSLYGDPKVRRRRGVYGCFADDVDWWPATSLKR